MNPLLVVALLLLPASLWAKAFPFQLDSAGRHEMEVEVDAYYSAVDYIMSLTEAPIPKLNTNEQGVYSYLLSNITHPRFTLFEVSLNPLPLAGVATRRYAPGFYRDADWQGLNAVQALTAGFPEPGALSFFLGNVADFVDDSSRQETGKGYSGALLSVGNFHIVQNRMVRDWWAEGEIKLKGADVRRTQKLSWSFRTGSKVHQNPDIRNSFYISITRSRVDLKPPANPTWLDFLTRNSEVEWRTDVSYQFRFTRFWALAGKKWPNADGTWAYSLSLGVVRLLDNGYQGELAQGIEPGWGIVVRPNIVF